MAELLIQEFQPIVARVRLNATDGQLELKLHRGDQEFGEWTWPREATLSATPAKRPAWDISEAAVTAMLAQGPGLVAEDLQVILKLAEPRPASPVWLYLLKPYGSLGGLPWEGLLGSILDRPVLRLPDFTDRQPENPKSLDVCVCCDGAGSPQEIDQARSFVEALLKGSPRPATQVYVFARSILTKALRRAFAHDRRVWVASPERSRADDSMPWMFGMVRGLGGRSVDHVHFIGRAAPTVGGLALAMAEPSARSDRPAPVTFCSPGMIGAALTELGAWSSGFTPVPESGVAEMRGFADAVAQARPGAVTFSTGPEALQRSAAFLFALEPGQPPRLGTDFIYCHPSRIDGPSLVGEPVFGVALRNAGLFESDQARSAPNLAARLASAIGFTPPPAVADNTPSWIAATQRYVEACALRSGRDGSADVFSAASDALFPDLKSAGAGPVTGSDEGTQAVFSTLKDIQDIAAAHALGSTKS